CDPPFFHKADRLYPNYYGVDDHARIAKVIQMKVKLPWVVSYDSCTEIVAHYSKRRSFCYMLQYNAAKAYKGAEIFILSDKICLPERSSVPAIHNALRGAVA